MYLLDVACEVFCFFESFVFVWCRGFPIPCPVTDAGPIWPPFVSLTIRDPTSCPRIALDPISHAGIRVSLPHYAPFTGRIPIFSHLFVGLIGQNFPLVSVRRCYSPFRVSCLQMLLRVLPGTRPADGEEFPLLFIAALDEGVETVSRASGGGVIPNNASYIPSSNESRPHRIFSRRPSPR